LNWGFKHTKMKTRKTQPVIESNGKGYIDVELIPETPKDQELLSQEDSQEINDHLTFSCPGSAYNSTKLGINKWRVLFTHDQ
jgi:hypothetical protein